MKKYLVQHIKDIATIVEIEVEPVALLERPALGWILKPGENYFKLIKAPINVGTDYLYSWFLQDTEAEALLQIASMLEVQLKREVEKYGLLPENVEAERVKRLALVKSLTL